MAWAVRAYLRAMKRLSGSRPEAGGPLSQAYRYYYPQLREEEQVPVEASKRLLDR